MINIDIFNYNSVDIEGTYFHLGNQHDMIHFLKYLLDKIYYSGETICLEECHIDTNNAKTVYTEIERWPSK